MAIKRFNASTQTWEYIGNSGTVTPTAIGAVPTSGSSTISGNLTVSSLNTGQLAGMRNILINGGMQVWQRGAPTTASPTAVSTSSTVFTADRWNVYRAGSVTGAQYSQNSDATNLPADFRYALRVQRVSANTSTADIVTVQNIETQNAWALRGKPITLSFYARAGANYSSSAGYLNALVKNGTGTDEPYRTGVTYTGESTPISGTSTLTTSWQRFSFSGTASTSLTEASVVFSFTPVGTAGTDDWFEITGVQLEISPVATPFEFRSMQTELALCQRYYWQKGGSSGSNAYAVYGVGRADGTTSALVPIFFPVEMRIAPTNAAGNFGYSSASHFSMVAACTTMGLSDARSSKWSASLYPGSTSLTLGAVVELTANNTTNSYISFNVEM